MLSMNKNIQMDLISLKRAHKGWCWPLPLISVHRISAYTAPAVRAGMVESFASPALL